MYKKQSMYLVHTTITFWEILIYYINVLSRNPLLCSYQATDEDIEYAWKVITDTADEVIEACETNKAEEEKTLHRIASLSISSKY